MAAALLGYLRGLNRCQLQYLCEKVYGCTWWELQCAYGLTLHVDYYM